MRIIFAGTPEFAEQHLAELIAHSEQQGWDTVAVYTQPDRPAGRGKKLQPSAVKTLALEHNIPVEQPESLRTAKAQQQLSNYQADVMVVVAYGLILPQAVLDIPRFGCLNVHGSLLPRWRGAAPIQRAIEAGDERSGVTIMQMNQGLDTGDILYTESCPIEPQETSASLYAKLAKLGPKALVTVLADLESYRATAKPQDDQQANYAHKLSKAEAEIDWHQPAAKIERQLRAFTPWPGLWFSCPTQPDKPVKVHKLRVVDQPATAKPGTVVGQSKSGLAVATAEGCVNIEELQWPGKAKQPAEVFLNGYGSHFPAGLPLSSGNHGN
ncbi:methionyl-tRNA formyltransferase [Idiomarina tyrosinivorans]|nr:methionyl-tRNA formyltransferase [Idiomarina tyrosinivorans]